jgi:ribosomal protein S18 acetylase RimI-like enzyme
MQEIKIRKGKIEEVVALSRQVTEFFQPYSQETYEERMADVPHLILIAEVGGKPAGFKVGYQRYHHDTFYSWMGGVLPAYRHKGIATRLADEQEKWVKNKGYKKVIFKTRNRLSKMIHFGLNRGFVIIDLVKKGTPEDYRIVMEKAL